MPRIGIRVFVCLCVSPFSTTRSFSPFYGVSGGKGGKGREREGRKGYGDGFSFTRLDTSYFNFVGLVEPIVQPDRWTTPVYLAEKYLELIHTYTGLPWWSTIIVGTLALRCFMLPSNLGNVKNMAIMMMIKPETQKLQEKIQQRKKEGASFEEQKALGLHARN